MGGEIPRDPVPPPHTCRLPPEISPSKGKAQYLGEACRHSVRNVGWEVRAGGGEVESRGPSPWGWNLIGGKRDKRQTLDAMALVPPSFLFFGFPEFLRLFPRKLS